MKKIIFILVSIFTVLLLINGTFKQTANSSENQYKKEHIYNNQLSKAEKQQQEKELEEFLKKENKPNALLPLPNPEDRLNFNGMPLPDGESVEAKNLN
jgi:hypothetical protein